MSLALAFMLLFLILLLLIGRDLHTIRATVETCEVPAVELEHHRSGQLGIAAEISFFAALISLVSGVKGRKSMAAISDNHIESAVSRKIK